MKQLIQMSAIALLIAGFVSPFFVTQSVYVNLILALIAAGVLLSLGLGVYWFIALKKITIPMNAEFESNFENVMRGELFWLQGIRPKMKLSNARQWTAGSSTVLVGSNYATAFIFVIFVFAVGVLYMLGHELNPTGMFGALLGTSIGKGLAVSFLLYLLVSSASIFITGVFSRFSAGTSK
jgi:hypothetical protein